MNVQTKNSRHCSEPGSRCLVEYFRTYLDAFDFKDPFCRRPLPVTSENPIRYGTQVVGINKLKGFMKSVLQKGGLQGNYTNNSGKKTCATQLYIGGVHEAEIMSVAGHRSQQGVRKYMRSNVDTKKNICKIFDAPSTNSVQEPSSESSSTMQESLEPRKRPASPENFDENNTDAKRFCPNSQHILRDLSNAASVFNNSQFLF